MKNNINPLIYDNFGRRLREFRGGLSQKAMAEKLEITQAYLCEIEKGKRMPSFDRLCSFAEALDITVTALLGEDAVIGAAEAEDYTPLLRSDKKDEGGQSSSIEMLLADVKHRLQNDTSPMDTHTRVAITALLRGCLKLVNEKQ